MARDYTIRSLPATPKSGIDYASDLNEKQLAAVTAPPGPALVIAGAGSGKTRTLTYRVAYLLDNGIYPSNILLLTFTNKAAREMLERVGQLVPFDTKDLWGGTFHSVGNRILRQHADELGFTQRFSILDREDQKEMISSSIADAKVDGKGVRFPKPEVIADVFSLARNMDCEISELVEWKYPYFEQFNEALERIAAIYDEKKLAANSMDFDDLLVKTLQLLRENPDIRRYYQKQFEWVLVDEYQDTNKVQADLIDLFAAPQNNVMVVGDDAQSIYSWRGADFRNILEFPDRYEGTRQFVIETNYRSVPEILRLANAAIAPNREQFRKNLAPARAEREELPALIPLQDTRMQATFVAQRIEELHGEEGVDLNEIAVLYRAHFHSMDVQLELTRRGIPFNITSGLRFFEQAHIKDVASFMKFASNRSDEMAFKRIAKMLPGIGAGTADKLWQAWLDCPGAKDAELAEFSEHLIAFKVPSKAREGWNQFAYTLDELLDGKGGTESPAMMIPSILEGVYDEYLQTKFPNYDARRQDLRQLELYAKGFEDVDEFLTQLSLLAGQDTVEASQSSDEAVTLSSVHQAKGLEYQTVFLIWLAEGMFPSRKVLESEDEDGQGLEEERRLFYVAVTRAKDELYLTYPLVWQGSFSGDFIQHPSRFIEDLSEGLTEQWNVGSF